MAVPARPVAGALLDSAWGGLVHDQVVAKEFQSGTVSMSLAGAAEIGVTVVFPHPFGALPVITLGMPEIGGSVQRPVTAKFNGLTVAQFGCVIQNGTGAATTAGPFIVNWLAYGTRA